MSREGVAFVARSEFVDQLVSNGITGFEPCAVEVVTVATLGKVQRARSGDPEDQILGRRNVIERVRAELPALVGVRITGEIEVRLRDGALTDSNRVQPWAPAHPPEHDLRRPMRAGKPYGGHLFCSSRLLELVDARLDNVAFTPFVDWASSMWAGA